MRLTYGEILDKQIIANRLGISQLTLMDTLQKTKSKLEAALIKEIDNMINKYLRIVFSKIYKAVVKSACKNLGIWRIEAASLETKNAVLTESLKLLYSSKL